MKDTTTPTKPTNNVISWKFSLAQDMIVENWKLIVLNFFSLKYNLAATALGAIGTDNADAVFVVSGLFTIEA